MNKTTNILLFLLFVIINLSIYLLTEKNAESIINNELEESVYDIETHNDMLLTAQKNTSYAMYKYILRKTNAIDSLKNLDTATPEEKQAYRNKLYTELKHDYKVAKKQGLIQLHFVDKNNVSFLRMNNPQEFGDNLTQTRLDFTYVHKTHEFTSGFFQGKDIHGFGNLFPIYDKEKNYIGAMEMTFSSKHFQWYLNHVSNIHSHFIVDKDIFQKDLLANDAFTLKYAQSSEVKNYLLTLTDGHTQKKCIDDNKNRLKLIKNELTSNVEKDYDFALYVKSGKSIIIASFLPITDLNEKTLAWVVTYRPSSIIKAVLESTFIVRVVTFFLSLMIIYFLVRQILSKKEIQKQYKLFDGILNTTEDVLFITDFKSILFSNDKYKTLPAPKSKKNFNILDLFVEEEGSLHQGLLEENENFISLLERTESKSRIVSLYDDAITLKTFSINATSLDTKNQYLISLSDITELQSAFVATSKKAYTDKLTNVYNRYKFDELFNEELLRVKRYKSPLSIALIDIDKFKNFNDTFGHLIGDEVLVSMAQNIQANIRDTDTFARWGGEEFIILFTEADVDTAKILSLKIKDVIEENEHPTAGKITGSFGLTQYIEGDTMDSMFKRCDDALYVAKENGRNRVEIL